MSRATSAVRVLLRELATLEPRGEVDVPLPETVHAYAVRIAVALGDEDLVDELRELVRLRAMVRAGRAPALEQVQRTRRAAR